MVNPRFWTFQCCVIVIFIFVIFVIGQSVESKKHHVFHPRHQTPQHHHRHNFHRQKHPKIRSPRHHQHQHHPALVKNDSRFPNEKLHSPNASTSNSTPIFLSGIYVPSTTGNATLPSGNSSTEYPKKRSEILTTTKVLETSIYPNFGNVTAKSVSISNSTVFPSTTSAGNVIGSSNNLSSGPVSVEIATRETIASTRFENSTPIANNFSNARETFRNDRESLNLKANVTPISTTRFDDFLPGNETLQDAQKIETVTDLRDPPSTTSIPTQNPRKEIVKDLEVLFGPTQKSKDPKDVIEAGIIRKKRSSTVGNVELSKRSLLDFEGPFASDDDSDSRDDHKRVKRDRRADFDDDRSSLVASYLQDLENSFPPSALEIQARKSAPRSSDEYENKWRIKREANVEDEGYKDAKGSAISNEQRPDPKDSAQSGNPQDSNFKPESSSRTESKEKLLDNSKMAEASNFDGTFGRTNATSPSMQNRERKDANGPTNNRRKSALENSYPNDDNALSRNRLDDGYPEAIEDQQHPSSLVQLVRTKRDGLAYPNAGDVANEQSPDSGGIIDEPFAEDNRAIDSMLSKVDYNQPYGQTRYARKENGETAFNRMDNSESSVAQEPRDTAIRDKRDLGIGRRRARKARKHKKKKGKKKKKRKKRPKNSKRKRASFAAGRTAIDAAGPEPESKRRESRAGENAPELEEVDVVSPHDGRRRRDYEDENEDNYRFDNSEPRYYEKDSGCVEERDNNAIDTPRIREKRENPEFKYYKHIRENDQAANASESVNEVVTSRLNEPIKDIKNLVQELLLKVNDLHGYANDGEQTKDPRGPGSSSPIKSPASTAATDEPPKSIQRKSLGSSEKSKPKSVNPMRRRKSCRKSAQTSETSRRVRTSKDLGDRPRDKKMRLKRKSHRKWDRWTDWSSCSVTCGRGRQIRWRHCIRNCSTAETEMEEKACQLPACAPGKFLGIFGR